MRHIDNNEPLITENFEKDFSGWRAGWKEGEGYWCIAFLNATGQEWRAMKTNTKSKMSRQISSTTVQINKDCRQPWKWGRLERKLRIWKSNRKGKSCRLHKRACKDMICCRKIVADMSPASCAGMKKQNVERNLLLIDGAWKKTLSSTSTTNWWPHSTKTEDDKKQLSCETWYSSIQCWYSQCS